MRVPDAAAARTGAILVVLIAALGSVPAGQDQAPQGPRFTSGVELINVTATVSDANGRFVPGLSKDDFVVYEDDQAQTVTYFSAERVPVSVGIVLDTSGSMAGDKIRAARGALDRFLDELLDRKDEIFLYRFSEQPELVQPWTDDRRALSRALERMTPYGGTAMYDAVAEAIPLVDSGSHRKKAVVLISDGNDTASRTRLSVVRQLIRESEALIYAIGIDGESRVGRRQPLPQPRVPVPFPFPFPPGRRPGSPTPPIGGPRVPLPGSSGSGDRVDVVALRDITDESGGRTEIIRSARDLAPATASIADELSRQYFLGYVASGPRDGRWHSIRVEVRNRSYRVRARRGYVAS
jgi:VWFA-related protein